MLTVPPKNLLMPGNPRYQPTQLAPYFGYDNQYRGVGEVELATLDTLIECQIVPAEDAALLTPALRAALLDDITTTDVDVIERSGLGHDIRAWVHRAQQLFQQHEAASLGRWLHVPLTSFDPLHTGRILLYLRAWENVVRPHVVRLMASLALQVENYAHTVQIGRTHGQHALPITVGFWLATILQRVTYNARCMHQHAAELVGKIAGAVGAYNAQIGLGFDTIDAQPTFEERVLSKLGLRPAPISTQLLPPEPLANFLHSACLLSAALGQFGMDCRHLMRTEIGEVAQPAKAGVVGSSTMPHKRNPDRFENLEAMWRRNVAEYQKVFLALNSEHQRDLVGSPLERDFPIILINLQEQLNTLLKMEAGVTFVGRMRIDQSALQRNFDLQAKVILAEPLYIVMVMAGYRGDAHALVNNQLVPAAMANNTLLAAECVRLTETDEAVRAAWERIPPAVMALLHQPKSYLGRAPQKALQVAATARQAMHDLS